MRENKLADTAAARVTLADIPFYSLRHGMPNALLAGRATLCETVAAAQRAFGPAELLIDLPGRRVRASGVIVELPPTELAFLSLFARRRAQGLPPVPCPPKDDEKRSAEVPLAEAFLREYRAIIGEMGDDDRARQRLQKGMDGGTFMERKSELHSRLGAMLGPGAQPYKIHAFGDRPRTRYGLKLQPEAIRWVSVSGDHEGGGETR